jgi:hypothetical protein
MDHKKRIKKRLFTQKKYVFFFKLVVLFSIVLYGCKKADSTLTDRYYVKYEVKSTSVYTGGRLYVTINDKDSSQNFTVNTKVPWETVIGPVQKGFLANLDVRKSGTSDATLRLYTQISVSVNNEPFVLKKIDGSDAPRNSVNINYAVGN